MGKLQRSWELFKCALNVVVSNKKLLLFPIVTSIFTIVILLVFITPLAFWNTGHSITEAAHWKALGSAVSSWTETDSGAEVHLKWTGYAIVAAIYLFSVFLATFFNVAFFNEIIHALNRQPVSIVGGLKFAASRLKAIIMWSLLTGVVGLIIKFLEERVGLVGRLILRLIGIAWSVAAVFTIPVIVREEKSANPVLFLKTSAGILRKTWGESLAGYVGIQLSTWIIGGGSMLLLGLAIALSIALSSVGLLIAALLVWFLFLIVFAYLLNVLSQVYRGALFIYATEGVVPEPFVPDQMNMAWKMKKPKK